ncbi:MAG: uracil-DNA glycosylase [Methylococcales bacterium]|nr:uracil-DNA glycosylase [Methylococcales bacterium]
MNIHPQPSLFSKKIFDQHCQKCPRLSLFLKENKQQHPNYHALPVAPFGDKNAQLLVVGLAPGMHGANATGRPFTGDFAGLLLYQALYDFGFSNKPISTALNDGLKLTNARITNAVKCLPPQNKPTRTEVNQCNPFLQAELKTLPEKSIILALGGLAHNAILKTYSLTLSHAKFGHNVVHELPCGHYLVDSYHTSRYNVQTKRLNSAMFADVFKQIQQLLS